MANGPGSWAANGDVVTFAAANPVGMSSDRRAEHTLRIRLRELLEREAEEADRTSGTRRKLIEHTATLKAEDRDLQEDINKLQKQQEEVADQLTILNAQISELPDQAAREDQWTRDRLEVLWSAVKTDRHRFDAMRASFLEYRRLLAEHRLILTEHAGDEDVKLLEEAESDPQIIAGLPSAMRAILEEKIARARELLDAPVVPTETALLYVAEAPAENGAMYMLVIPTGVEGLRAGDRNAELVNAAIGAFTRALIIHTEATAPISIAGHDELSIIVCATAPGPPAGVVAVATQEELDRFQTEGWGRYEIDEIDDVLFAKAIAEFCRNGEKA